MARFVRVSTQSRAPSPFGDADSDALALKQQAISNQMTGYMAPGLPPKDGLEALDEAARKSPPWLPLGLAVAVLVVFFWKGK